MASAANHRHEHVTPSLGLSPLSRVRLDELLQEMLDRVGDVVTSRERLRALLDAVVGIGSDLDLRSTLQRIVESACELVGAKYGALGVIGPDRMLHDFIIHGIDDELHAKIGDLPHGRGVLGLLIDDPRPLRMPDITQHPKSYGFPKARRRGWYRRSCGVLWHRHSGRRPVDVHLPECETVVQRPVIAAVLSWRRTSKESRRVACLQRMRVGR